MQRRGTELKKTAKTLRQSVLEVAGIEQPLISRKEGLANSVVLGRSWNKHRKVVLQKPWVKFESEKAERNLQKGIRCGDIKIKRKKIRCGDIKIKRKKIRCGDIKIKRKKIRCGDIKIKRKKIRCGDIKIKRKKIRCADNRTAPESTGYVGEDDLPSFVSKLLDQFQ